MSSPPQRPKIFHITHVDNLAGIVADDGISADARRIRKGLDNANIGMSNIKRRRLRWVMPGVPGYCVGDFVPFYFCPRSIMLYMISRGNNSLLDYADGQAPIVHLMADFHKAMQWAEEHGRPWAFTDANAATGYARFLTDAGRLDEINWEAVAARYWSEPEVKDGKQAEFLLYDHFPWGLVEGIGVMDQQRLEQVQALVGDALPVQIKRDWYY